MRIAHAGRTKSYLIDCKLRKQQTKLTTEVKGTYIKIVKAGKLLYFWVPCGGYYLAAGDFLFDELICCLNMTLNAQEGSQAHNEMHPGKHKSLCAPLVHIDTP